VNEMKRVLMITSAFPPPNNSGRKARNALRAKLLFEHGWETVVLTKGEKSGNYIYEANDKEVEVYQCPRNLLGSKSLGCFFVPPDPFLFSHLFSMYLTGKKIVRKKKVDAIYTMSQPENLHLVGLMLKRKTGLPWIAEFQDPLAEPAFPLEGILSFFIHLRSALIERMIVKFSDRVVYYKGNPMPDDYFYQTYPSVQKSRFFQMPYGNELMGYDPEEFEKVKKRNFDRFTITYAGSFYGENLSPKRFLTGLHLFINRHKLTAQDLRVMFLGDWTREYELIVKELGLDSIVRSYGWITREETLKILKGSDLLLLIIPTFDQWKYGTTSKFWNYIGAKTPILALVRSDFELAKIIRSQKLGLIANPNDAEEIADALERIYFSSRKTDFFSPTGAFLRSLDAKKGAKKFSDLLNEIAS
jgi:glycosyltransferase involved in cell wall biosynthesis